MGESGVLVEAVKQLFYNSLESISVSDLKDYLFCPSILWIKRFLGYREPATRSMLIASEEIDASYKERVAERLGLPRPWRIEIELRDPETGLVGSIDLVAGSKRVVVAEIKRYKRKRYQHFRTQLLAYAYLANKLIAPVERALLIQEEEIELDIPITKQHLEAIEKILRKIRETIEREEPPPTNKTEKQCTPCQYKRICPNKQ